MSQLLGVDPAVLIKALPVVGEDGVLRLALVRGDDRLNEIKLRKALGQDFRPAADEEITAAFGAPPGFIGPVGVDVEVIADSCLERGTYIAGANREGYHLRGVEPGRDFRATFADIRTVRDGDVCPLGGIIAIEPAIEVGNIFKLGTRYSEPLGARYLDEDGREQTIVMGSYGIGPARIAAAAVEQYADEQGISWPRSIAPFDVHLVALGKPGSAEVEYADRLYESLTGAGVEVIYDDRPISPGEKFVEAELLGCPLRVVAGKRTLELDRLEVQVRRGREARDIPLEDAAGTLIAAARRAALMPRMSRARTLGLSRPGDPAGVTRAGAPLRPLTLPNLVGYLRLAALVGSSWWPSRQTTAARPSAPSCFCIATWGDYADGMLARLTGQYSRLGALMDPLLDRLVVIAGAAVCWHFELLPRWAIAVLVAREAVMVVAVSIGLRLGLDISINWAGRSAVWSTMGAVGIALIFGPGAVADAFLYVGVAGSLLATALYFRDGVRGRTASFTASKPG